MSAQGAVKLGRRWESPDGLTMPSNELALIEGEEASAVTMSTQIPPGYYNPEFDSHKFKELMLHIAHECKVDPHLGMIKICQIIFYCDFNHYWLHGTSITGTTYVKAPRGPLPHRHDNAAIGALVREDRAKLIHQENGRVAYHRLVPHPRQPRPVLADVFSEDAIDIIQQVIEHTRNMTTSEIATKSHRHPGWVLVEPWEVIPYELSAAVLDESEL